MKTAQNKLPWIKIKISQFGCHDALGGWLLSRETRRAGEDRMAVRGQGATGQRGALDLLVASCVAWAQTLGLFTPLNPPDGVDVSS